MTQLAIGRRALVSLVAIASALALAALLAGCNEDCWGNCHHCEDNQPPAVPTGVGSITGDTYVLVYWNPVYEADLAGYGVYRSNSANGAYARIGEVRRDQDDLFRDEDLTNGVTYYYAVDAFDEAGNESDLSYETVDDTPRPEGWDAHWYTRQYRPEASGIAILPEQYDAPVLMSYADPDAQYYLTIDASNCMRIVPKQGLYGVWNLIQDYGYTTSEDQVDEAPTEGWSTCRDGVEVVVGHSYVLKTAAGYYGKLRVTEMASDGIIMYWAFQGKWGSTELAPKRGVGPKRG
ncbi:MAG TPA: hypothetical protein VMU02_07085 [bacterium]|nr:hypothetical protein [bacterium]